MCLFHKLVSVVLLFRCLLFFRTLKWSVYRTILSHGFHAQFVVHFLAKNKGVVDISKSEFVEGIEGFL